MVLGEDKDVRFVVILGCDLFILFILDKVSCFMFCFLVIVILKYK